MQLINWTNNNLKDQFINIWIQNAYLKNEKYIFVFFKLFSFSNPNTKIYLSQIAQKNQLMFCLFIQQMKAKEFMINCLDVLEKEDKNVGSYSGRNPFKLNKQKYNAEIMN